MVSFPSGIKNFVFWPKNVDYSKAFQSILFTHSQLLIGEASPELEFGKGDAKHFKTHTGRIHAQS